MDTPRSGLDWIFEGVSALALLAAAGDIAMRWSTLPERIPTHFGAAGDPNRWGDKNMLLLLLATTIVVAILLTIAESYQRLINIPMSVDRDSPAVRRLLRSMVIAMKAVITVSMVWIVDSTMRTAMSEANGLGSLFLAAFLACVLAPMIYYLVRLARL